MAACANKHQMDLVGNTNCFEKHNNKMFYHFVMIIHFFLLTTWLSCLLFEIFFLKKCKNTFIHHTAQIRLIFVCALCVVQAYEGCQKTILVSYWESFGLMSFCCGGHGVVFLSLPFHPRENTVGKLRVQYNCFVEARVDL